MSREVSKITSRTFYKGCVLKLSKTTNDVLAKIYILPVYYKNECSHGCMLTGTVN